MQKANLQAVAAQIDAQQRLAAVRKLDEADEAARVAWTKRHGQALAEEEQAIWDKIEAQVQATRVMGLGAAATEELTLADMQQLLAWRESLDLNDDLTESLKRRIAAQKQLIAETQNGEIKQAGIDAAKAAADAHKKQPKKPPASGRKPSTPSMAPSTTPLPTCSSRAKQTGRASPTRSPPHSRARWRTKSTK